MTWLGLLFSGVVREGDPASLSGRLGRRIQQIQTQNGGKEGDGS